MTTDGPGKDDPTQKPSMADMWKRTEGENALKPPKIIGAEEPEQDEPQLTPEQEEIRGAIKRLALLAGSLVEAVKGQQLPLRGERLFVHNLTPSSDTISFHCSTPNIRNINNESAGMYFSFNPNRSGEISNLPYLVNVDVFNDNPTRSIFETSVKDNPSVAEASVKLYFNDQGNVVKYATLPIVDTEDPRRPIHKPVISPNTQNNNLELTWVHSEVNRGDFEIASSALNAIKDELVKLPKPPEPGTALQP